MVEEPWRDQPQRPEGADDVVGIVVRIVHVGVVLQMHPGEHREAEPQQERSAMADAVMPARNHGMVLSGTAASDNVS